MESDDSVYGLAILGAAVCVATIIIILIVHGIKRTKLNWYERNLLETQYLEISPSERSRDESGGFWFQGQLRLNRALTKGSQSSNENLPEAPADGNTPLAGNNNVIITTTTNSPADVIRTESVQSPQEGTQELATLKDFNDAINESNIAGRIHLTLFYDPQAEILTVKIIEAQDLIAHDFNGTADPYAKIRLLPDEINVWQTRIHKKTINPVFDEDFVFEVSSTLLGKRTLEIIIYDSDTNKKHKLLGGLRLPLLTLEKSNKLDMWEKLCGIKEPDVNTNNGELLVSLSYLTTTECLTVSLLKARNLRTVDATRATSDPYVKLTLFCRDRKIKKCKTRIRRCTLNPVFNESFVFNISKEKLKCSYIRFDVLHDNLLGVDQVLGTCTIGKQKVDVDHPQEININALIELLQSKNTAGQWLPLCAT